MVGSPYLIEQVIDQLGRILEISYLLRPVEKIGESLHLAPWGCGD